MSASDETITRRELEAAIDALPFMSKGDGPEVAEQILAHVKVVRESEPDWQPGDVVRDDLGIVYVRDSLPGYWLRAGYGGRSNHDAPKRPLRRLAPEGSRPRVTREQVLGVLLRRSTRGIAEAAADDIVRMLEATP